MPAIVFPTLICKGTNAHCFMGLAAPKAIVVGLKKYIQTSVLSNLHQNNNEFHKCGGLAMRVYTVL